jgi:hypothetical protein
MVEDKTRTTLHKLAQQWLQGLLALKRYQQVQRDEVKPKMETFYC